MSVDAFRSQMAYLEEYGWTSISSTMLAAYLLDGQPLPPRPVMISVDDGNRNFTRTAGRLCRDQPAPGDIPGAELAEYSGYVNWDEMRAGGWRCLDRLPRLATATSGGAESELAWRWATRARSSPNSASRWMAFASHGGRGEAALAVIEDYGYRTGYSLNPIYWQRRRSRFHRQAAGGLPHDDRGLSDLLPGG